MYKNIYSLMINFIIYTSRYIKQRMYIFLQIDFIHSYIYHVSIVYVSCAYHICMYVYINMKFYTKVYISPYLPLPVIFAKSLPNCVSFTISNIMHLFITFISYLFFLSQEYSIQCLPLLWGQLFHTCD